MSPVSQGSRPRINLVRTYATTCERLWAFWTTREGIEAWWGPDGFGVTVESIDLRAGGALHYRMEARRPEMVAFMEANGMPVSQPCSLHFTVVEPYRLLSYVHLVDFVPGVASYDVMTTVQFEEVEGGVRLSLSFDAMHEQLWTDRAVEGWTQELEKLRGVMP